MLNICCADIFARALLRCSTWKLFCFKLWILLRTSHLDYNKHPPHHPSSPCCLWTYPDLFFDHQQKVPASPCFLTISWNRTILRMKISPSSQNFGHGQCQESYLLGLILGLIYKLPCEVYLDSCSFSPFGNYFWKSQMITMSQTNFCGV